MSVSGILTSKPKYLKKSFLISVVVPCYNEEDVIKETYKRLSQTLGSKKINYEIIFCDDGSRDNTPQIIEEIANKDERCRAIILSRNFGHQFASFAAIENSKGDAVILIDADLQDPPEVMLEMIKKWKEGYEVVYGKRRVRQKESLFKKFSASAFYRFFNMISDIQIPLDTGDFRIMDRRVVDVLIQMPERDKFLRGMISWIGFKQDHIYYDRDERFAGKTKYTFFKMIKFAASGIFSFSTVPLKVATWLGALSSLIAFVGIIYIFYVRLLLDDWVQGWAFTSVIIMFFGGAQLFAFGIMGEYVGRIYRQDKKRPVYIVDKIVQKNKN